MLGKVPDNVFKRPKKGFNSPTLGYGFRSLTSKGYSGQIRTDFRLDPKAEDITYKSFALGMLDIWLDMFSAYRNNQNWSALR